MFRLITLALALMLLLACAVKPVRPVQTAEQTPWLALTPASFAGHLAVQQRLSFDFHGHQQSVDALLEIDPETLQLVLHTLGQPLLRLHWDGRELQETRSEGVPASLSGERVLSDLQFVYWHINAIKNALPAGWKIAVDDNHRRLFHGAIEVLDIEYKTPTLTVLTQRQMSYQLTIESTAISP